MFFLMILYLSVQFQGMEEMGKDAYVSQEMVNDFSPGMAQYELSNSNFMPSIGIVSMARTPEE